MKFITFDEFCNLIPVFCMDKMCEICIVVRTYVYKCKSYCITLKKKKLRGLSPRANYTDRAAAEVSANFCG